MKKEMLINVLQPEECRIAIVEDGILEELYVERTSLESYTGNIYKGRIVNIEPAIQAAFVDFSVGRNGFLHVSDVEPQYYRRAQEDAEAPLPAPARDRDRDREEPRRPRAPRDRDRDREEPRRPRIEAPAPPPPRRDDPDDEERIGWDRYDRPDRSERGRRDRSIEPRRFGEGLYEDERPAPPARPEYPREEARRPRAEAPAPPAPPAARYEEPEPFDQGRDADDDLIGWSRPEPKTEPKAEPAPTPVEDLDQYLPPNRTRRERPRRAGAEETPAPRGRGPAPTPVRPSWPEPADIDEPEPVDVDEPESVDEPGDAPRRRGGRAAIRARGGDREPTPTPERERRRVKDRPRDVPAARDEWDRPREPEPSFGPEPIADPVAERPWGLDEPGEPTRERERERPRSRSRDRDREATPERPRTGAPRAGEPGYVPRREREKDKEPVARTGEAAGVDPDVLDWLDPKREVRAESPLVDRPDADDEAGEGEADKPRRRRRRRRRREAGDERAGFEPGASEAEIEESIEDEIEADLDRGPEFEPADDASAEPTRARRGRSRRDRDRDRRKPVARPVARLDEDADDLGDDEPFEHDHDPDAESDLLTQVVDDPVDPELEEEIRREVEEIRVLERELGLRGPDDLDDDSLTGGVKPFRGGFKPPIQDVFRRGDEVLVQVIKESIGAKGPTLSTYISIPGRYLVLMPGLNRVGVSRKIADEGQRRKLRQIMNDLNPPKGLGFIVRTAGLDRTRRELGRDLAYLLRLWKVILRRIKKARTPAPIYQESDMIIRTIRDIFSAEIDTIWIDERHAFERAQEFMRVVMPKFVDRIKYYEEKTPLFHKYGLEDEIARIQRRRVEMPGGGSLVIDQTEALVAIDVNSGNFRVEDDADRTAYEMNLRAAKEIARQLRLRDLGGVIVNDFIDMRDEKHRRGVERALREAVKRDRARTKILRMSQFGLVEMTRQRIRPSLKRSVYEDCNHCSGAGVAKTAESMAIDVMRLLALAANRHEIRQIHVVVSPAVATYLNNRKRKELAVLESESDLTIHVKHAEGSPAEHLQIECFDAQSVEVRLLPSAPTLPFPRRGR